jgi:hypothetical protein
LRKGVIKPDTILLWFDSTHKPLLVRYNATIPAEILNVAEWLLLDWGMDLLTIQSCLGSFLFYSWWLLVKGLLTDH